MEEHNMEMKKETENGILTVYLEGKLDTGTAPQAEKELEEDVNAARQIILDFKDLIYLSSAGLRLVLKLHKTLKDKDGLKIRNVNESIMEIFDITGFTSILNIE